MYTSEGATLLNGQSISDASQVLTNNELSDEDTEALAKERLANSNSGILPASLKGKQTKTQYISRAKDQNHDEQTQNLTSPPRTPEQPGQSKTELSQPDLLNSNVLLRDSLQSDKAMLNLLDTSSIQLLPVWLSGVKMEGSPDLAYQPGKVPEVEVLTPSARAVFLLSGGLTGQIHQSEGACNQLGAERSQLGFYIKGQYHHPLGKNFYALGLAQFTAHRSLIEAQATLTSKTLNALNQEVRIEETTYYELYNEYDRVDFGIGLGKEWSVHDLKLMVSTSANHTTWIRIDGDFIDSTGDIQMLSTGKEAKAAWGFGLNTMLYKPIGNHWTIGLELGIQHTMLLSEDEDGCRKDLSPGTLGVVVGHRF